MFGSLGVPELTCLIAVIVVIVVIVIAISSRLKRKAAEARIQRICRNCGYVSTGQAAMKGTGCIELLLWCLFIIPGLIYSLWRVGSEYKRCPQCGQDSLIPLQSPVGQKMLADLQAAPVPPPPAPPHPERDPG